MKTPCNRLQGIVIDYRSMQPTGNRLRPCCSSVIDYREWLSITRTLNKTFSLKANYFYVKYSSNYNNQPQSTTFKSTSTIKHKIKVSLKVSLPIKLNEPALR